MTTNVINQVPFLRTSREFPENLHDLAFQASRSYVDIANAVNERIIGIYPVNRSAVNGESWFFIGNTRQRSLRQLYTFTATGSIPHGIDFSSVYFISPNSYGSYVDSSGNYYGVIFGSSVAIAGQVSFYVTSTNIVILSGAGAPAISNGIINLEWISNV